MSVIETEESQTLAGMLPGPVLADALAETALGGLDEYALVEAMRAARRLTAWAESVELAAVAELDLLRGHRPAELSATVADLPDPARGVPVPARAQARPSGSARTGRRPASGAGDTGRDEAAAITHALRTQLVELHDQVRGFDRSGERRVLVAEATRRVKDALAPLKSRWCHVAADSVGDLVHGHDGYRPPEAMRRLVQARNGTCTFPTCRRNAMKCDLDHTIPYDRAGRPARAISRRCAAATTC